MEQFNVTILRLGQTIGKENDPYQSEFCMSPLSSRPTFSTHGVISGNGIGQSDFLWNVRSNPRIKQVFTQIWNDPQLLVSFDGCGIFRDWRYDPTWKTQGGWNHVDQNPKVKPDRCCI